MNELVDIRTAYYAATEDPLPHNKQLALIRKYKAGDKEAGQRVIQTNLRLVILLADKFAAWAKCEYMDLIQAGNMGLCRALTGFDPDNGTKFTSYAAFWIRARLFDEANLYSSPVRVSSSRVSRKILNKLSKARKKLRKEGIKPTPRTIAEEIGDVSPQAVLNVMRAVSIPTSLETTEVAGKDSKAAVTLKDAIEDNRQLPDIPLDAQEDLDALRAFGAMLPKREKDIWDNRICSAVPDVLHVLGDRWDISKERVRQVELIIKERYNDWVDEQKLEVRKFNV